MLTKKSVPLKNVKSFDKVRQPLTIFKNNLNCVASTNDSFNNVPNFSFSILIVYLFVFIGQKYCKIFNYPKEKQNIYYIMPEYPKILDRISKVMEDNNYPSDKFVRKMLSLGYTKQNFINFVEDRNLLSSLLESPIMVKINDLNDSFVQIKIVDFGVTETKNDKFLICYDFEILNSEIKIGDSNPVSLLTFMQTNQSDFMQEHVTSLFVESFKEKMKDEYYLPFIFSPDVIIE